MLKLEDSLSGKHSGEKGKGMTRNVLLMPWKEPNIIILGHIV